ncbi:MAG TPA: response regulator [Ktedonobacterales bacterium]
MPTPARSVLVVEDDRHTAAQLRVSLESGGYDVTVAADGERAIRLGRTAAYTVMTVDRMLPSMDGIEIIRHLRQGGVMAPALIISALGEVDERARGLRLGGDDYLVKPFASLARRAQPDTAREARRQAEAPRGEGRSA